MIVLDQAPEELVRLVGYLGEMADKLIIDLITVAAYSVNGSQVIVPQRVEPERERPALAPTAARTKTEGYFVEGEEEFAAALEGAPADQQPALQRLYDWALALKRQGLAKLGTYHGKSNRLTLLPRLPTDDVGLVTIWNDHGAYLSLWRSVLERRAPKSLARVEELLAPTKVGQGNTIRTVDDALLEALTQAYREAAGGAMDV